MIEQSENPAIFRAFIEKFPDAPQRQLAELKLMMLSPSNTDSKDNSLPAPNTSELENLSESKTDDLEFFMDSGSNERYHWTPETVEDKEKKLIWQRREAGKKSYVGAQGFCEELQLAGVSDWRLPMMSELRELNRQITSD